MATRLDLSLYTNQQLEYLLLVNLRSNQNHYLSAGDSHSMIIIPERSKFPRGQVHGAGSNIHGQLGFGPYGSRTAFASVKKDMMDLESVVVISASTRHSLILNSQGQVYSFGSNLTGQLGLGDTIARTRPVLLEDVTGMGRIMNLSAGNDHSLFLNSQGQVFSCGSNRFLQLGLGGGENKMIPTLIDIPIPMIAISAGGCHSLLLDSQGRVYSFGSYGFGQLGLVNVTCQGIPTLIDEIYHNHVSVIAISAGHVHSLILTSQGQVFSFGGGAHDELGNGGTNNESLPHLIRDISIYPIVAISAGHHHSLVLDSYGQIYSFGGNIIGKTRMGGHMMSNLIPILINRVDKYNQDTEIKPMIAISAGGYFSLILDSDGHLFSCGNNNNGQLGLGDTINRNVPTLVLDFRTGESYL
jgi:alpha-tubulin suppressor-like RCC1 family protein